MKMLFYDKATNHPSFGISVSKEERGNDSTLLSTIQHNNQLQIQQEPNNITRKKHYHHYRLMFKSFLQPLNKIINLHSILKLKLYQIHNFQKNN